MPSFFKRDAVRWA